MELMLKWNIHSALQAYVDLKQQKSKTWSFVKLLLPLSKDMNGKQTQNSSI